MRVGSRRYSVSGRQLNADPLGSVMISRGLLVAVLMIPWPALAGGVSWAFKVSEVRDASKNEATLFLVPENTGPHFPESCAILEVHVRYQREPLGRRTWSREVPESKHAEALDKLHRAAHSKELIRFGSMGNGLVSSGSDHCSVRSRGLAVLEEFDGTQAVFSFYDPI